MATGGAARKRAPQRRKDRHGPLAGRWGRVGRPQTYTTAAMVGAVVEARGVVERAAPLLGCSPETIRRRAAGSAELRRAISLMRSRSAQASFKRRERERRQREREEAARREALQADYVYRPSPRVELVYVNEAPQLVQREADPLEGGVENIFTAPAISAAGRRHAPPPWARADWVWVTLTAPATTKHEGQLLPGDEVLVPARQASGWISQGLAEAVEAGAR